MADWRIDGSDLGIKQVIEDQEDETFPRDLPCGGWIRLYKNYATADFSLGVLKQKPELVKGFLLMVVSALVGDRGADGTEGFGGGTDLGWR